MSRKYKTGERVLYRLARADGTAVPTEGKVVGRTPKGYRAHVVFKRDDGSRMEMTIADHELRPAVIDTMLHNSPHRMATCPSPDCKYLTDR